MILTWLRAFSAVGVVGALVCAAERPPASPPTGAAAPVLRGWEPADTGVFTLPGAPAPPPRVLKPFNEIPTTPVAEIPVVLPDAPEANLPVPAIESPLPAPKRMLKPMGTIPASESLVPSLPEVPSAPAPKLTVETPAILRRATKIWFPPDFERDSAAYCQQRIGEWTQPDAYNLMGKAVRQRPAAGDDGGVAGQIYAFADPTNRYKEIELDFAADSGLLRTVFVYPRTLTWVEARRLWGSDVSSTDANKGRVFYSFTNRRLDVLVGADGKVISLGLY